MNQHPTVRKKSVCASSLGGSVSALAILCALLMADSGHAQSLLSPSMLSSGTYTTAPANPNANMVVNADQLIYNQDANSVTARGRVQVFYDGRTVEADELVFNNNSRRLQARGHVRLTDRSGAIAHADELDMDEKFRDGFIKAVQIETPDRLRFAGVSARRERGEILTIEKGVYTACEPCKDNPTRPPLWQIKAAKIIHNATEKEMYFEDMRLEFVGVPVAYLPYFWTPDPSVRKKSGFMVPNFVYTDRLGIGAEVTYFWNIAPNYDLTVTTGAYGRQGFMPVAEWRHATENGQYSIRGGGIFQMDRSAFANDIAASGGAPGNRDFRGFLSTKGEFKLADQWKIGWDATLMTDQVFLRDYGLLQNGQTEANSSIYLRGESISSWFDLRATKYQGVTLSDRNERMPYTLPTLDYFKTLGEPILAGELSWKANVVNMYRQEADFMNSNSSANCDLAVNQNRANCRMVGMQGAYSRATVEVAWRKRLVDTFGQIWEPYLSLRGDIAGYTTSTSLSSYGNVAESNAVFRAMPTVGLTYRYPWVARHGSVTSTIEPIVQFIARPDEMRIGDLPNEDAQSLVFDDASLFSWNKFSGYDRVEGGGRANYGLQYTARLDSGQSMNVLFGQSRQLFGINSFTMGQIADTAMAGANSGLDKTVSDYVGRVAFQIDPKSRLTFRGRFDESTFAVQRGEVTYSTLLGPLQTHLFYAYFAPQPILGYLTPRSGVGAAASMRVWDGWSVHGSVRYAFERPAAPGSTVSQFNNFEGYSLGISYLDECYQFGFFYSRDYQGANLPDIQRYMFRFNLRTLGDTTVSSTTGAVRQ